MSARRDYYEILGCDRGADAAVLKSSYRKLAMKFHPDQNGGCPDAETKFKEVNEAYAVLSDPQKRAAYDRFGHDGVNGNGGFGGGGQAGAADFADIFEQVFGADIFGRGGRRGGHAGRNGPARGADIRADVEITLEDAFKGKEAQVAVASAVQCGGCNGSGAEAGTEPETCPTCAGAGRVRATQGFFTMERACPTCGGQGRYVKNPCVDCDGIGLVREKRHLMVNIPAGVEDGTRIRLSGEGDAGARGGPQGDLYLFVSVRPHDLFERDGPNLYCRACVPMATAALGGEIEAPTIDGGRKRVKIPEGSQTGKQMRLRGEGMSQLRSAQRGDMMVELFVETPRRLNPEQRALLEEFREVSCNDGDCHPESHGFMGKVKRFFEDVTSPDGRPDA